MSGKPSAELKTCPACAAENFGDAAQCWLCRHDLRDVPAIVIAEEVRQPPSFVAGDQYFAALAVLLALTVIVVLVGVFLQEPALAVMLGVILVPALVGTLIRVKQQQARHGHVSWAEKLLTFILSVSMVIGGLALLVVAAFVAFFLYCIAEMSRM
jgi:hypothetical protein